jgi:tetratricopeptide (TPR) repeat protein
VRAALEKGELERAHELLTSLLAGRHVREARDELAGGRNQAAWDALQKALRLAPADGEALALRRELAGPLLAGHLERARTELAAGRPRDAMLGLDAAFGIAPRDPEVLFLRGECARRMGLEDGDVLAFTDARDSFLAAARAGRLAAAWSGAARAQYLLYFDQQDVADLRAALEYARRGRVDASDERGLAGFLATSPARIHAEIAVALQGAAPSEEGGREARQALEAAIGETPEDPWAWTQIASLDLAAGRLAEAREILVRALALAPADATLHEWLAAVSRQIGGYAESVATYAAFTERQPEVPLGWW